MFLHAFVCLGGDSTTSFEVAESVCSGATRWCLDQLLRGARRSFVMMHKLTNIDTVISRCRQEVHASDHRHLTGIELRRQTIGLALGLAQRIILPMPSYIHDVWQDRSCRAQRRSPAGSPVVDHLRFSGKDTRELETRGWFGKQCNALPP